MLEHNYYGILSYKQENPAGSYNIPPYPTGLLLAV